MDKQVITTVINFLVTGALGYCVSSIKNINKRRKEREFKVVTQIEELKKRQIKLENNLLIEMRNELSNEFYIYDEREEVEDYLVMAFRESCEKYFEMGGDNWIHPMYNKSFEWKIKPTKYTN